MRARRDRFLPAKLRLTQLEDRSVPAGFDVSLPPSPPFDGPEGGLNTLPPTTFLGTTGLLTGPQAGDPLTLARQVLTNQTAALGLAPADVANARLATGYADADGAGTYHAYFVQSFNGLDVFNTAMGVHLLPDGSVTAVSGAFVPNLPAAGAVPAPAVSAAGAVAAAASYFGITLTSAPELTSGTFTGDYRSVVSESELSRTPISTRLVYVNTPVGVRTAWEFNMDVPAPDAWYNVAVDAATGQVTFWNNWTQPYSATYNVLKPPIIDPVSGPRSITVNPFDPVASPFGWHDTNGVAGAEFTDTRGNNVFAQFDPNDTSPGGNGGGRPDGGLDRVFNNPLNLASAPTGSSDASTTNLFYLNNILHDVHFKYGFNEASGNFQFRNYTGQGLGNDQVIADALDGSSVGLANNAFMSTPPEGSSPNMAMFLFDITTPFRDGSFATQIVVHEYGHGVSTRLTGGAAANSNGLTALQSRGMGEGWSDFWALMFTQSPTSQKTDANPQGQWVLGQPPTAPGVRRFPYSFDMSVNPLTFDVYGTTGSVTYQTQSGPQTVFRTTFVHDAGEVWCSALWDMNWLLIDKYGFDKDLSTGYVDNSTGPAGAGNKLAMRLVMDALKLQPANPSFIDARDAILLADRNLTGGENQREIWAAFARRGLGFDAFTRSANDDSVSTTTAMPPAASNPGIIAVTPAGRTVGGGAPASITFTFSEGMDTNSFNPAQDVLAFSGPSTGDLRNAITGFQWIRTNPLDPQSPATRLQIFFTPPANPLPPTTAPDLPALDQGLYQMRLSANILSADTQAPLDQNLSGGGSTANDEFVANFRYDAVALTATLSTAPSAADPTIPGAIIAVFNEPVLLASLNVGNLQVSQGTVANFIAKTDANGYVTVVQYNLTGVTSVPLYATLKLGAVTDLYGFPNEVVDATFGRATIEAVDFPTPFPSYGALGWGSFATAISSSIVRLGQKDMYAVRIDAGQSLSILADRLDSLRVQVRLFDPDGNPISTATGELAGDPVAIGPIVVPVPGRYFVQISGTSNSTGDYRLQAFVNTSIENETGNPTTQNDTQFQAETINGRFATQGAPGSTLQAVTIAGNVGRDRATLTNPLAPDDLSDFYRFNAVAGQPVAVGLLRAAGANGTVTLQVTDQFGLPVGVAYTPTNFDAGVAFTPAATGNFLVRVQNTFATGRGTEYALTIALNAVIDRESAVPALNNNLPTGAQAVPLNTNVRGGLTATDQDWYSFTLTATTDVFLTSFTPADGPDQPDNRLDPTIEVIDANGDPVASATPGPADNAAGDGKNALFFGDDLPTGTYRFRVRPSPLTTTATSGEYVVQVSAVADPGPVAPNAGGPYTSLVEGGSLALNATATDPNVPDGSSLTYSWDLNGDQVFGDAVGKSPMLTWPQLVALGITDGPATFTIRVRVSDGVNPAVTSPPSSIVLNNAPTPATLFIKQPAGGSTFNLISTQSVNEGAGGVEIVLSSLTAPASGLTGAVPPPVDPATLDNTIGLRYSFDTNNDGLFNDGYGDGSYTGGLLTTSITLPASLFADGPGGGVTIRGQVIDKDNGITVTAPVTFTIVNLNPTLGTLTGSLRENRDGTVTVTGSSDPSVVDRTSLRYSFDLNGNNVFDDGAGDGTYAGSLTVNSATVPAANLPDGTSTSTATFGIGVFDKDGGSATQFGLTLPIQNTAPTATLEVLVGGSVAANPTVAEGSGATARITNVDDDSSIDDAGPFTYQFDFGYNAGVGFEPDVSSTSLTSVDVPIDPFLNDGNATTTVAVRVFDKDGDFTQYEKVITVTNVAPVGTLGADPVTIGQASNVRFTGQFDPSPQDTLFTYVFTADLNADGDVADLGETQSGDSSSAAFTFPSPGNKTVTGRITDKDGSSTTYSTTVVVENVQPGATLVVPPTVTEGSAASVTVTGTHPSAAVVAAGFGFEFDFNGDGTFDLSVPRNPAAPVSSITVPVTAAFLADGLRPLTVRVRVTESFDGKSAEFTAPMQVLNGNPTATFSGPAGTVQVSDQVTFNFTNVTDPSAADRAGLRFSVDLNNDGDFADDGEIVDSTASTVTTQFRTSGAKTVRGRVTDKDGGFTDYPISVAVLPKVKGGFAAGVDAGNAPLVQLYDAAGNLKFRTNAFDSTMTGGVRVAVADVNGDGVADLVAGTGPGVVAEVRVIDGKTGTVMFSGQPFEGFTGGVFVAAGDMDGDGRAEFAVSPDMGGGPRVIVYRGNTLLQAISFLGIDDLKFRGGARVGMADMNGDGRSDLLVSAGFEGGPRVAGFEGSGLLTGVTKKLFNDFFVFEPALRNGSFVTGGDVNGDGFADLVAGAGPGGAPRVTVYDGASLLAGRVTQLASFFTGNNESRGGVRVAVADLDADGLSEVITGEADGPRVNIFLGKNVKLGLAGDDQELMPFSTPLNGVFVG